MANRTVCLYEFDSITHAVRVFVAPEQNAAVERVHFAVLRDEMDAFEFGGPEHETIKGPTRVTGEITWGAGKNNAFVLDMPENPFTVRLCAFDPLHKYDWTCDLVDVFCVDIVGCVSKFQAAKYVKWHQSCAADRNGFNPPSKMVLCGETNETP